MFDGKAFGAEMVSIVRSYVDRTTAPIIEENKALRARIDVLESRDVVALATPLLQQLVSAEVKSVVAALPAPQDGTSVTVADVAPLIAEQVKEAIAAIPAPKDGASVTLEDVTPLIAEQVKGAVAALPAPKDGRDGTDVDMDAVQRMIGDAVAALPAPKDGRDGADGKSVDPDTVKAMVAEAVATIPAPQDGRDGFDVDMGAVQRMIGDAVAALPAPKDGRDGADGKSVDPDTVKAMVAEAVAAIPAPQDGRDGTDVDMGAVQRMIGEAVAALPVAKDGADGAGIADLLIDRSGSLIATFTDGRMKDLGHILGKDGRDGTDGSDGIPFGVDDINMTLLEDGRTVRMAFTKGDTEYAFQIPFPVILDRGVFAEGKAYEAGDGVTWGGSFWIAQRATAVKPDGPDSGWRLAVKRGRDGKDKA